MMKSGLMGLRLILVISVICGSISPLWAQAVDDYVWVANEGSNNVTCIKKSDSSTTTIAVGNGPYGVAALPNGNYVYVTNQFDDNVSVIRASDNREVATISVGDDPQGVAVLPNGNAVYVTNSIDNTVSVIGF